MLELRLLFTKAKCPQRIWWLYLAACTLLFAPLSALAEKNPEKKYKLEPMISAPVPKGKTVTAYIGEKTEIDLQVRGRIEEPMKILIRKYPQIGTLSDPVHVSRNLVRVFYSVPAKSPERDENFSYAVQSKDSPVSIAAQVQINIRLRPTKLHFPSSLDFGSVPAGDILERVVVVENSGGVTAELDPKLNSPWVVLNPLPIKIGGGKSQKIRLSFSPVQSGRFAERLILSSDSNNYVTLTGASDPPLQWPKQGLLFESQKRSDPHALATFTNVTDKPRTLTFEWPAFLEAPTSITIEPNASTEIPVTLIADPTFTFRDSVTFSCGQFKGSLPITVQSAPACVNLEPSTLDLGEVFTGTSAKGKFALTNSGGQNATVSIDVPKGILVEPSPKDIQLAPGSTVPFEVTVAPQKADAFHFQLPVNSGKNELGIFRVQLTSRDPLKVERKQSIQPTTPKPISPAPIPPNIPSVQECFLLESTTNSIKIEWKLPSPDISEFFIERREISLDENTRPEWVLWKDGVNIELKDNTAVASFRNLPRPGAFWIIRISGTNPQGQTLPPSPQFRIETRPASPLVPFWMWILILLASALGIYLRKNRVRFVADDHNERISHLEK